MGGTGATAECIIDVGDEVHMTTQESRPTSERPSVAQTEETNGSYSDEVQDQGETKRLKRIEESRHRIEEKRNLRRKKWEDEDVRRAVAAKQCARGEGEDGKMEEHRIDHNGATASSH